MEDKDKYERCIMSENNPCKVADVKLNFGIIGPEKEFHFILRRIYPDF